jgi:glycosyltransferase involved in cell wall biosynthesis
MYGLSLKYADRILLQLFKLLLVGAKKKISKYQTVHLFETKLKFSSKKQVLHIDDPEYTQIRIDELIKWENSCISKSNVPIIICTNSYTYKWLATNLKSTKIFIVEQGYHSIVLNNDKRQNNFSCVYTSPYIHYGKDKHAKHSTWGSEILIDEIIPRLNLLDPEIHIHLVGQLGSDASQELKKFRNVYIHGRVNFQKNIEILSSCSVGIYPRNYDHKRSVLKIFSYIGAGLPIVTFDLIDTEVVKANSLGFAVDNTDEFITSILDLKNSPELMLKYEERIKKFRIDFTWSVLAGKMESILSGI